jgi:hypothetical protein
MSKLGTAENLRRYGKVSDADFARDWHPVVSNDTQVYQLSGLKAPKSTPQISSKASVEAIQVLFALIDAVIIFLACLVVCPTISTPFVLASISGTVLFVLGKALLRGYSRTSLA